MREVIRSLGMGLLASTWLACGESARAPLKAPVGDQQTTLQVGQRTVLESIGPRPPWGAVFEDDGQTGWFYALDRSKAARHRVLDALRVYDVATVRDRTSSYPAAIRWSKNGQKAGLFIEGNAHAVFDFGQRRGYGRTNSPPTSPWSPAGHAWSDSALLGF